jgi:hypothetical protein
LLIKELRWALCPMQLLQNRTKKMQKMQKIVSTLQFLLKTTLKVRERESLINLACLLICKMIIDLEYLCSEIRLCI